MVSAVKILAPEVRGGPQGTYLMQSLPLKWLSLGLRNVAGRKVFYAKNLTLSWAGPGFGACSPF
jgi:hypothetical protein